jgi:hypothetical protein
VNVTGVSSRKSEEEVEMVALVEPPYSKNPSPRASEEDA